MSEQQQTDLAPQLDIDQNAAAAILAEQTNTAAEIAAHNQQSEIVTQAIGDEIISPEMAAAVTQEAVAAAEAAAGVEAVIAADVLTKTEDVHDGIEVKQDPAEVVQQMHHDAVVLEASQLVDQHGQVVTDQGVVASQMVGTAEEKDTSALIAEAAAAAVAAAVNEDAVVTAAALAVKADDEAQTKKNEQRRKRYREKSLDDEGDNKPGKKSQSHEDQLAARRLKDRQRYANMTPEQRQIYNSKRREQYHRQSEASRQRRRERERSRYHSLDNLSAKERNARRAKLERERYQRLTPEELESKNRKRRERAAMARQKKAEARGEPSVPPSVSPPPMESGVVVEQSAVPMVVEQHVDVSVTDPAVLAASDEATKAAVEAAAQVGAETVAAAVEAAKEAVEKAAVVSI